MEAQESHRRRCRRYDVDGHTHCLTLSCFRRQPFFRGRLSPLCLMAFIMPASQDAMDEAWGKMNFVDRIAEIDARRKAW